MNMDWIGASVIDEVTYAAGATFCPLRQYRYSLWRRWDLGLERACEVRHGKALCAFIGLNPSTADETTDDPTVRRCINFAKTWGFGGMIMLNAFAWRDTDPHAMKRVLSPEGLLNDEAIAAVVEKCGQTVCCWGSHGTHRSRDYRIRMLLAHRRLYHLGLTKQGQPLHPLYLKADTPAQHWKR